jgi:mono/diheme cytochrome c family protein
MSSPSRLSESIKASVIAIRQRWKWWPLLGILLLAACGSRGGSEEGQAIYLRRCLACHGETGVGDGPTAKMLGIKPADLQRAVMERSREEVLETIAQGRNLMPAFDESLSAGEREAVYEYLRTLPARKRSAFRGLDPTGAQGLR